MTLIELNKIEQVLKENLDAKYKAREFFIKTMREKYDKDGDNCWFREKMNGAEKETYETLLKECDKASGIYRSFVEHNWQ